MALLNKKFSSIVAAFDKMEADLVEFTTSNAEEIKKQETKLAAKRKEQEQANRMLKNVARFLGKE